MDAGGGYNPRTVEEVFGDFKGRRAGMVKALTTGIPFTIFFLLILGISLSFSFHERELFNGKFLVVLQRLKSFTTSVTLVSFFCFSLFKIRR